MKDSSKPNEQHAEQGDSIKVASSLSRGGAGSLGTGPESKKLRATQTKGERHRMVPCPSCSTRYAVEDASLTGIHTPKFHCSKCDAVFSLQLKDLIEIEYTAPSEEAPLPTKEAPRASTPESVRYETSQIPEKTTLAEQASPTTKTSSLGLKSTPFLAEAPHEESLAEDSPSQQLNLNLNPTTPQRRKSGKFPFFKVTGVSGGDLLYSVQREDSSRRDAREGTSTSGWKGFSLIAAPILGFLGVLFASALYLSSHVEEGTRLLHAIIGKDTLRIPPGVAVRSTTMERLTLDSGEKVYAIRGKIMNDSDGSLHEVRVQSLLFDETGETIAQNISTVGSPLTKAELEPLTLEMIQELQVKSPSRRYEIKRTEEGDFTSVISEKDFVNSTHKLNDARFFSTRVFSTK